MSVNHPHLHHSIADTTLHTSERGIWAIKLSFVVLTATALLQGGVVLWSGSVALLADAIHNVGDAATAIPLWIAFRLVRLKPNKRFSFGYGRFEDLAGVLIVVIILSTSVVVGTSVINRFLHPQTVAYPGAIALAAIIGFLGNEGAAILRIRVGKEIGSAALIADGYHARADGWVSLSVLIGAAGVWLGFPLADPIVGSMITVMILILVWKSASIIFLRLFDGVEPGVIDEISTAARTVEGVREVTEVRARWVGHRLHADVNIAVRPELSVFKAHGIAKEVYHQLLHRLSYLSVVMIHVDPLSESGEAFH